MYCFASTYTSGFKSEIEAWLKEICPDCTFVFSFDGLIVYKTRSAKINAPFFNNTFLVLGYSNFSGKEYNNDVKNFFSKIKINFNNVKMFLKQMGGVL